MKTVSIKIRPSENFVSPSKCNKLWTNFDKTMLNECERKIAATFGLKTFEILKSYGFKIKIYFFIYLNFHITISGLKKISSFFLSCKVMKTKRETLELNLIGGQI